MSFSKSIGGKIGSGAIKASANGLNRASGGPVSGYAMPKSSKAPGANTSGASKPEPKRPLRPVTAPPIKTGRKP